MKYKEIEDWINAVTSEITNFAVNGFILSEKGVDRHGTFEWTLRRTEGGLVRYVVIALDTPGSDESEAEVWAGANDDLHFTRRLIHADENFDAWNVSGLEIHVKHGKALAERLTAADLELSYPAA